MIVHEEDVDFEVGPGRYTIEILNYGDEPIVIFKLTVRAHNGVSYKVEKIISALELSLSNVDFILEELEDKIGKALMNKVEP